MVRPNCSDFSKFIFCISVLQWYWTTCCFRKAILFLCVGISFPWLGPLLKKDNFKETVERLFLLEDLLASLGGEPLLSVLTESYSYFTWHYQQCDFGQAINLSVPVCFSVQWNNSAYLVVSIKWVKPCNNARHMEHSP